MSESLTAALEKANLRAQEAELRAQQVERERDEARRSQEELAAASIKNRERAEAAEARLAELEGVLRELDNFAEDVEQFALLAADERSPDFGALIDRVQQFRALAPVPVLPDPEEESMGRGGAMRVTDDMVQRAAEALARHPGCTGGCRNRPCEPDYRDAAAILRAALNPVLPDSPEPEEKTDD